MGNNYGIFCIFAPQKLEITMKKLYILLVFCIAMMAIGDGYAQRSKHKHRGKHKTHKVAKKKKQKRSKKKVAKFTPLPDPRLLDPDFDPYLQCEDTCNHVHGIDLSHYQGEVFWETIGENTKTAYVYLKATEGGDRIDSQYERNIELAHRHGLKVGSYHFFRPKTPLIQQLHNFTVQCRPGEQDLIPMIDIESTGGLSPQAFCDSLFTFLGMIEKAYRQMPLLYTGRNFYNKYLQGKVDDYKIMIAMYTPEEPELADGRDITMWQYTSKGRIIGVNGWVDKSRFMGDHGLREIRFRHFTPRFGEESGRTWQKSW